jgi:PAS domain S-box-containing protein
MKDNKKTQKQLIKELAQLRRRIVELEASGRERNRFEETLRAELDKTQQYLDIAEVILVALNKKGEISLINRKGNQILGYNEEELLGKNWFTTCVPSHCRKKLKNGFLKLMAGKRKLTEFYENPALTKSGTERIIAWHNTLVGDTQGNPIGTLSSGEDITKRREAEEALKESESRFRNIIENSKDGIIFFDGKTRKIVFGNGAMAELLGCSKADLVGRSISSLHPSKEWASVEQEFQKHVRGEISASTGIPVQREDGSVFYADISSSSTTLNGRTYFSAFFRDITERKQAEDALRESEQRYRKLFEGAAEGILIAELKSRRFLYANPAVCKMLGYSEEELKNLSVKDIHPRESLNHVISEFEAQARDEKSLAPAIPCVRKNGEIIYADIVTSKILIDNKECNVGFFTDITWRKRAEEEQRESEARFRTLFEAIPDSILVHDDEGTILHINEIGAQQLEWSVKDLVGRNLREIVAPENHALIAVHIKETYTVGWCRFETTYVSRSGWKIVVDANNHPINFGTKKAILRVARDITERKEAEKALIGEKNFSNAVINSSPGLMFVFGEKGNIIQWNSNAENVTSYSASEISKMNVLEFVAKEYTMTAAEAVQEALTKGQASVELDVLTKPGKKIPFFIAGRRTKIENAICVVCAGMDITERKQAEEAVKRSYEQLKETLHATVNALASTVETKDQYTAGHQPRVTQLACAIAEEMGLPAEQIEGIRMAASIHDLGKVLVPAEILNKPGPLTEIQYEMIKMHPQAGYDILKGIKFPWPVAEIVLQHHEMMDGSGYPQGLTGKEIMLEARILMVANVIEAMNSHRPYRPAFDMKVALEEISKNRGVLYDQQVVDACIRLITEKAFAFF